MAPNDTQRTKPSAKATADRKPPARRLAELGVRVATADRHLEGLERFLRDVGHAGEAAAVRNARAILAGTR